MPVKPIPDGYHSVTPYLVVEDGARLIEFLKTAFDAKELYRMPGPNGRVMHAEVEIGDSRVMLGESTKPLKAMLNLYVADCDSVFKKALAAGAKTVREMATQFYGDRSGGVEDPFGNQWFISTHVEDVSPEEMNRRMMAQK